MKGASAFAFFTGLAGMALAIGAPGALARDVQQIQSFGAPPRLQHTVDAFPSYLHPNTHILRVTNQEDKFLYEGYRQLKRRSFDRAMRNFSAAMQQNPENAAAYRGIALIYWHRDSDMQAAGVYFRLALSKPMVTPELSVEYASYLATVNKLDDGLEHLYKTLDRWPKAPNVRAHIAYLYYQKKNQVKACQWANTALEYQDELQAGLLERACGYA